MSTRNEDDHLLDDAEGMELGHVDPEEADRLLSPDAEEIIDKTIKEGEQHLAKLRASLLEAQSKKRTNSTEYKAPTPILPSLSATAPASSSFGRDPRQQKMNPTKNIPKLMDLVNKGPKIDKSDTSDPSKKPSYAAKAAKSGGPVRPKEIVEDFLNIYESRNRKIPISRALWEHVDGELITLLASLAEQGQSNPGAKVAHSGFDAYHLCGFIACRDSTSAEWYKERVAELVGPDGESFRAWGKADLPISRLCRIYIPDRFYKINDDRILPILAGLNPPLQKGELSLKDISKTQGGRAVFVDVDMDTYSYIRTKSYKLEWLMGCVDCHGVAPNIKTTASSKDQKPPGVEGVVPLNRHPITQQPSTSSTTIPPLVSPSSSNQENYDSDVSSAPSITKSALSKHNLAFSPLTPVKEARALEEEGQLTPAKSDKLDPRKRASLTQKTKGGKARKTDTKSKDNFYKSLNKSK